MKIRAEIEKQSVVAAEKKSSNDEVIIEEIIDDKCETDADANESTKDIIEEVQMLANITRFYKQPNVKWHQTKSIIFLKISAIDIETYNLHVTIRNVQFRYVLIYYIRHYNINKI